MKTIFLVLLTLAPAVSFAAPVYRCKEVSESPSQFNANIYRGSMTAQAIEATPGGPHLLAALTCEIPRNGLIDCHNDNGFYLTARQAPGMEAVTARLKRIVADAEILLADMVCEQD